MTILGMELWNALAVFGVTLAASAIWAILLKYVWEPLRMKRIMGKQGVTGPPYRFLFGNILELIAHQKSQPVLPLDDDHYSLCPGILPHHTLYAPKYGKAQFKMQLVSVLTCHWSLMPCNMIILTVWRDEWVWPGKRFIVWWGPYPRLVVQDPEVAKEVLSNKFGFFSKTAIEINILKELLGHGLTVMEGEQWAINRRTLNPMFHREVLKVLKHPTDQFFFNYLNNLDVHLL